MRTSDGSLYTATDTKAIAPDLNAGHGAAPLVIL